MVDDIGFVLGGGDGKRRRGESVPYAPDRNHRRRSLAGRQRTFRDRQRTPAGYRLHGLHPAFGSGTGRRTKRPPRGEFHRGGDPRVRLRRQSAPGRTGCRKMRRTPAQHTQGRSVYLLFEEDHHLAEDSRSNRTLLHADNTFTNLSPNENSSMKNMIDDAIYSASPEIA